MGLPLAVGLGAVLATIIVPLVVKLLLAFGIGFITYTGIDLLLGTVLSEIQSQIGATSFVQVINLFGYLGVDTAITMMISAVTIRATLRGLQAGGNLRKLGFLGA